MKKSGVYWLVLILTACGGEHDAGTKPANQSVEQCATPGIEKHAERRWLAKKKTDAAMKTFGLVDVQSVNATIRIDLKYASDDNFMGKILYDKLRTVYVQQDVAERLSNCQKYLDSIRPGYALLVYDGVRPLETQQKMWDALDTLPVWERSRFVSNPANRSLHNFGAAVDLTIVDEVGTVLDMGAGYDDIRKIAYPSMEQHFLATGELTAKQVQNRQLLRRVMRQGGFTPIQSEWWHFNACTRATAKWKYSLLEKEPE